MKTEKICNECRFSTVAEDAEEYGIIVCKKDGRAHKYYDEACKKFKQNRK